MKVTIILLWGLALGSLEVTIENIEKVPSTQEPLISVDEEVKGILQSQNETLKESIKTRIRSCRDMTEILLQFHASKVTALQKLQRGNDKLVRQKLMGAIMSECYRKITLNEARNFGISKALNHGPSLRLPFGDYNSPDAWLELTRDEELVIRLMKEVRAGEK
eukprot:TRINITY_DN13547_c0_g1_i2.p2 TRINITY_DN13547_c0_g1~~TRINITY_DN13547_c0_g1_i2.p2  ORF type:complete len:163 (-),score=33.01 TRINITY_DN13547_c0_g1_i2:275-763(-)